jgi:hypothetical protein
MKPLKEVASTPTFIAAIALCVITVVGLSRIFEQFPAPVIGLVLALGTLLFVFLHSASPNFRAVFDWISTERLMCWHTVRAPIGAAFLIMASEGLLPELFAKRAGWGDIFVAFSGMIVVVAGLSQGFSRWRTMTYVMWNVIGFLDLLLAVGTGIYLANTDLNSMIWMTRLPLLLVPCFVLPILFGTHIVMLMRLFDALRSWPENAINRPKVPPVQPS